MTPRLHHAAPLILLAGPAAAAGDTFVSLRNSDFVVLISFIVFIGILVYFRVPGLLMGLLDKRADTIRAELDEARRLREDAQALLASYERKSREAEEQAQRIVQNAKREAEDAAEQAKSDLRASVARRLQGAEDRIASAEAAAIKAVRDRAAEIAVASAAEVIAEQMPDQRRGALIDDTIEAVRTKLH